MSKERVLIALGVFTAVLPFLGFPRAWKTILFLLTGVCVATLAYLLRKELLQNNEWVSAHKKSATTFVENGSGRRASPGDGIVPHGETKAQV